MAQLLERGELPKQQADHVKVMLEAGRGLKTLLDDVIALSRDDDEPAGGRGLRSAAGRARRRAPAAAARLGKAAAPDADRRADLPRVAADPRRVRQVLLKLADNALKFTERGWVEIRLDEATRRHGQRLVRFTVTDTGHGVAPEVAHMLFKPFSPGDFSYARHEQGAGLGLAVAKRIVEQAGGNIGFDSEAGRGRAILVHPAGVRRGSKPRPRNEPDGEHPAAPPGLSLLLSCARPTIARHASPICWSRSATAWSVAANLAEAVARAGRENFDAIISGAGDADMLAAAPGVKAPLIAVMLRGDARTQPRPTACCAGRWQPAQLYRAHRTCPPAAGRSNACGRRHHRRDRRGRLRDPGKIRWASRR